MCNNTVWLPWRDSSLTDGRRGHGGRAGGGPQVRPSPAMASVMSKALLLALLHMRPKNNSTVILEKFWKDTPKLLGPILSRH